MHLPKHERLLGTSSRPTLEYQLDLPSTKLALGRSFLSLNPSKRRQTPIKEPKTQSNRLLRGRSISTLLAFSGRRERERSDRRAGPSATACWAAPTAPGQVRRCSS